MPGKLTDAGAAYLLGVLFSNGTTKPTSFTMRLFTDTNALADADTSASHTASTATGYADVTMSYATGVTSTAIPTATWGPQSFVFGTQGSVPPSIKGYMVLQGTTLLFEELLSTPYTPALNGDTLIITPSFSWGNGTPE